jgi:hypothetical protein
MYKSPIDILVSDIQHQIAKQQDEEIYKAVVSVGVNVDKEELVRALAYDRHQYMKGYADGEADATPKWIPVTERLPENFVSVLGYMTDAGDFPPVRECYTVGNAFFFPALGDVHPVSHWMPLPDAPKE